MGFLKDGLVDDDSVEHILRQLPGCQVTFHRAIEAASDVCAAVRHLKRFPQIDRVLTSGPPGSWDAKKRFLEDLQLQAKPEMVVIAGGGLDESLLRRLARSEELNEFHLGSAARGKTGMVTEERVSSLRRVLDNADEQISGR